MEPRIDYKAAPSGALQAMSAIDRYVRQSGARAGVGGAGKDARLPNEWLRILHRHAQQRRVRQR